MLTGRTVTKALKIESKQYEILKIDLGEGVRRRLLGLGALAFVAWIIVTVPLLNAIGLTQNRPDVASLIILAPPITLIMVGFMADDTVPQRMRVTTFALRIRFIFVGHRSLIGLGRRTATRHERMPIRQRLGGTHESESGDIVQPAIRRDVRARLISNDELAATLRKAKK